MSGSDAPHPGFHGWRMVGVSFLVDFVAVGFFFYSFGVYFKAIGEDLTDSRLGVSLGVSAANLVGGIVAPFIGRALDRHSIRHIMTAGALILGVGFALLSRIHSVWQYYLVLGTFFALGLGMMGGLASAKLVANWFHVRRGTAFGVATMGVSLSGLVMPTVATWLVQHLGWRGGFLVYALGTVCIVVPVVRALVVNRPEDVGQHPDGIAPDPDPDGLANRDIHWGTRAILRARNFWVISLPFALTFSALSAILIHLVPYADDIGIPSYRAAWVLSLAAGAGVVGKLVFGRLVDHLDARVAVWMSFGTQIVGLLVIMQAPHYPGLLAGALVFGFGMGGVVPLQGALAGLAFGRVSFGKVMGLMRPVQMPIHVSGIPLAAWIHDSTGHYAGAWWIFLGVYVLAGAIVAGLRVPGGRRAPPASTVVSGGEPGLP